MSATYCVRCESQIAISSYLLTPKTESAPPMCLDCALNAFGEVSKTVKVTHVPVDENTRPENEREDF